jgi:hypothetical protein
MERRTPRSFYAVFENATGFLLDPNIKTVSPCLFSAISLECFMNTKKEEE